MGCSYTERTRAHSIRSHMNGPFVFVQSRLPCRRHRSLHSDRFLLWRLNEMAKIIEQKCLWAFCSFHFAEVENRSKNVTALIRHYSSHSLHAIMGQRFYSISGKVRIESKEQCEFMTHVMKRFPPPLFSPSPVPPSLYHTYLRINQTPHI